MFSRPLIDALEFAGNGVELCGEVPLQELSRLHDVLLDTNGTLSYIVRGLYHDDRGMLELELSGACTLRCQRCLDDLAYPIALTSRLKLATEDELEQLDVEDDTEYIVATAQMDLISLIEEELLLSLPFAPRHAEGICMPAKEGLKQSASPFSVLAKLKK